MTISTEDFEVVEQIGKGSFGVVQKISRKSDGKHFVWKVIGYASMGTRERQQLITEVKILKELNHVNIVRFYDRILDQSNCKIYVIMEYCAGGDMNALLKQCKKDSDFIGESTIWKMFGQIMFALNECHSRPAGKILHRDLKPANIFFDAQKNVKLGDFGLSRVMGENSIFAKTNVGTPYYMSPEQIGESNYDEKSDIWSAGCLLYEMAALKPPFQAQNHLQLAIKIKEGKYERIPANYSEELQALVEAMLHPDPTQRPSAAQIIALPTIALPLKERRMREKIMDFKARDQEIMRKEAIQKAREVTLEEREAILKTMEDTRRLLEIEVAAMEEVLLERKNFCSSSHTLQQQHSKDIESSSNLLNNTKSSSHSTASTNNTFEVKKEQMNNHDTTNSRIRFPTDTSHNIDTACNQDDYFNNRRVLNERNHSIHQQQQASNNRSNSSNSNNNGGQQQQYFNYQSKVENTPAVASAMMSTAPLTNRSDSTRYDTARTYSVAKMDSRFQSTASPREFNSQQQQQLQQQQQFNSNETRSYSIVGSLPSSTCSTLQRGSDRSTTPRNSTATATSTAAKGNNDHFSNNSQQTHYKSTSSTNISGSTPTGQSNFTSPRQPNSFALIKQQAIESVKLRHHFDNSACSSSKPPLEATTATVAANVAQQQQQVQLNNNDDDRYQSQQKPPQELQPYFQMRPRAANSIDSTSSSSHHFVNRANYLNNVRQQAQSSERPSAQQSAAATATSTTKSFIQQSINKHQQYPIECGDRVSQPTTAANVKIANLTQQHKAESGPMKKQPSTSLHRSDTAPQPVQLNQIAHEQATYQQLYPSPKTQMTGALLQQKALILEQQLQQQRHIRANSSNPTAAASHASGPSDINRSNEDTQFTYQPSRRKQPPQLPEFLMNNHNNTSMNSHNNNYLNTHSSYTMAQVPLPTKPRGHSTTMTEANNHKEQQQEAQYQFVQQRPRLIPPTAVSEGLSEQQRMNNTLTSYFSEKQSSNTNTYVRDPQQYKSVEFGQIRKQFIDGSQSVMKQQPQQQQQQQLNNYRQTQQYPETRRY